MSKLVPGKIGADKKVEAEDVAEWIPKANGNISYIARALGVSRHVIYRRIQENPELQVLLDNERESTLDDLEEELANQALNGNITALIFALKTRGFKRGYVEGRRVEVSGDFAKEAKKNAKEDATYVAEVMKELEALDTLEDA